MDEGEEYWYTLRKENARGRMDIGIIQLPKLIKNISCMCRKP